MRRLLILCGVLVLLGSAAAYLSYFDPQYFNATLDKPTGPPDPREEQHAAETRFAALLAKADAAALEQDHRPAFSLRVLDVARDSLAQKAGMSVGDLIGTVNGTPVRGIDALPDQTHGNDVYSIWSPRRGVRELRFNDQMGIWYDEYWLPEISYAHSKELNPAWDKYVIVATQSWLRDTPVARLALEKAKAAGYSGWLLPTLSACIASTGGQHAAALKELQTIKTQLPKEDVHPVMHQLWYSALMNAEIPAAEALARDYAQCYAKPIEFDPAPLHARYAALSAADRALLNADGVLDHTLVRDYSANPERLNESARIMFDYLKDHPDYGFSHGIDRISQVQFGPLLSNPAFSMDFTLVPVPANQTDGKGSLSLSLCDASDGTGTALLEVSAHTDGQLALRLDGYPGMPLQSQELLHLDGRTVHHVELYVSGPWAEVWMNGRRVLLGLLPRQSRELYVMLMGTGVRAIFTHLTYGELKGTVTPAPAAANQPVALTVPPEPADPTLHWFHHALVDGYLNGTHRNPAWDAYAVTALSLLGRYWGYDREGIDEFAIIDNLRKASAAGCTDPLVQFALGDMCYSYSDGAGAAAGHAYNLAAENLTGSKLHPLLQFMIINQWIRYAETADLKPIRARIDARTLEAANLIPQIVADTKIPKTLLYENFTDRLDRTPTQQSPDRKVEFDKLFNVLQRCAPDSSLALTAKGYFYIDYAWDARGSGWAREVSKQGWQLFEERLNIAQDALEAAYEADPHNAIAPAHLLTVGMGLSYTRERMAEVFEQALKADPRCDTAAHKYIFALQPRWGGSCEEMAEFGTDCMRRAQQRKADECLAKLLITAHELCADDVELKGSNSYEQATLVSRYWAQPEVWRDVKNVYDFLLSRRPKSSLLKSEYAARAYRCGEYATAAKLLDELGDALATEPFGGPQRAYGIKMNLQRTRLKLPLEKF